MSWPACLTSDSDLRGAGNHQRDVIVLVASAELLHVFDDLCEQGLRRQVAFLLQCFEQAGLTVFIPSLVKGLRDSVGVEGQDVSRVQLPLLDSTSPLREKAQDCTRGTKFFPFTSRAQKNSRVVATVGVPEAPGRIVVLSEEQRGVGAVGGIGAK